jgi:hypothetical protein
MTPSTPVSDSAGTLGVAVDFRVHAEALQQASSSWMQSAVFARLAPDAVAITSPRGQRSFAQLQPFGQRAARTGLAQR